MKPSSKNLLILIFVLLLAGAAALWLARTSPKPVAEPQPVATRKEPAAAPQFSFSDMNGRQHNLSDYAGKTVILNFWASWCVPCVAEFPKLLKLAEDHKKDTVLIAMTGETNVENVEKFLSRHKVRGTNVVIARDPDKKITQDMFQTFSLPETIIIGTDGRMIRKFVGADWNPEDVSGIIAPAQE